MWTNKNFQSSGFSTPPSPNWKSMRLSPWSPVGPLSEKKRSSPQAKADLFHVIHKVPAGDSPYVRAKHVQLIEKDPSRAVSLFWAAINSGDRVDSALKDMAVVMKQLSRSDEAIEAIKSFRNLCPFESQESLDNILVELYKRSGRIEEHIEMLQNKVNNIEEGIAFKGKRTKSARSQGKKVQITIEKEYSRLLGNLAWAYLQQNNFKSAQVLYRKALSFEQDKNMQCNLAICLMHMNRMTEAKLLLQTIRVSPIDRQSDDSYVKSFEHATLTMTEFESKSGERPIAEEEEECHKEIRMPFTSLANRNLEELSSFKNAGQNYVCASRISVVGQDKATQLLDGQDRGSLFQSQHEDMSNCSGCGSGSSKYTSCGLENCSEPSPPTSFVDTLKKGSHGKNRYERTAYFGRKRNDRWISTGGLEIGSINKSYVSPGPARENPKVPFTQPRRCSCSFTYGDQRRSFWEDGVVRGCSRKLSFQQSMTHENYVEQLPASTHEMSKKIGSGTPCVGGNWRSWECLHEVNGKSGLQPIVNGELDRKSGVNDGKKNLAIKQRQLPTESLAAANYLRAGETVENSSFMKNHSRKSNDSHDPIADVLNPTQDLQSQSHSVAANLECSRKISTCKSKKTWADMVEEDEQELLSGRNHCPESTWVYPSQESSICFRTPSRGSDEWNSGDEFNDENLNSNIISETVTPLGQMDRLNQKIDSFDLKDGYYTQPENEDSSMNCTAGRFLCFDQHNPSRTNNYCSSPMPKVVLNFEGNNSLLVNERGCSFRNGTKLLRRNRLQVFRDITRSSGSPRP